MRLLHAAWPLVMYFAAIIAIAGGLALVHQRASAANCRAINETRTILTTLLDGVISNVRAHPTPGSAERIHLYQRLERERLQLRDC